MKSTASHLRSLPCSGSSQPSHACAPAGSPKSETVSFSHRPAASSASFSGFSNETLGEISVSPTKPQLAYQCGQQYSITALTDSSGTIVERYAYSAYGSPTITNATAVLRGVSSYNNRHTYTGREWDDVLLMYHYRARMYDSELGRFLGRDSIGYKDGFHLLKPYLGLSHTDPSGQSITIPVNHHQERILGLLNELCPIGRFHIGASGQVESRLADCPKTGCQQGVWPPERMEQPDSQFPVSCGCICTALGADCNFEIRMSPWRGGAPTIPSRTNDLGCDSGRSQIILNDEPVRSPGVPLFPDAQPDYDGTIPSPLFIILGHELCGHGITGDPHDSEYPYTPRDPILQVENCIREEHSDTCVDLGQRNGR